MLDRAVLEGPELDPWPLEVALVRAADLAVRRFRLLVSRPVAFGLQAALGGAMVAFGAMLALATSAGIAVPGLANLISGGVFGFSLVIIMVSEVSLVTADMALGILAVYHGRLRLRQYLGFVGASYVGNALGSFCFMAIVATAGGPYWTAPILIRAHALAASKMGMPDFSTFLLGILCTWLLQTAMILYLKARTDIGKMLLAYYGPLAFVAGMTEHSIANIGFLALPLLTQPLFTPVTHLALTASGPTAWLHWGFGRYGWAHDQLFTLLGNFVGGTLFVATAFQWAADPERLRALYQGRARRATGKARSAGLRVDTGGTL
ncbi:MAG: formate/nitrite transporter family protein [Firmicutes bacterium]|nr:formate/nitrite transporter family protein [Alicyclobacillaceae bacterium]MCL6496279.1 formate/nitrite transporter family protein [Bacillota bacterium]